MEQKLGTDAVKLTIVKVLTTFLTMLSAMLLSRFRTLSEYGTYSQIQLITTTVVSIFAIGMPNSINYFLAKADTKEERGVFLSVYYSTCTITGIVAGLFSVTLIPVFEIYFKNGCLGIYWYFLLLYPWTKIILSGIENILIVYHNIKRLFVFKVLYSVFTLLIILIAWLADISFYVYMLFFIGVEVLFSLWTYFISARESGGLKFSIEKKIIMEIFTFSLPIGLSSIISTISIEIDKALIGFLYTTEEMAIYTNASKEMPVSIIATSITAVLLPQLVKLLAKEKKEQAIYLWDKATQLSYIFIAFIAFALFIFAPEIITLLYSEKYLPGVNVFRVYSLVLLLRVTYFGMILNAVGKTKFIFYTSIVSLILNVVLNLVCYYMFGFIGPAIATFLSIIIMAFVQLVYTAKVLKIDLSKIFPWKNLFKITLINIGMSIIVYKFREMLLTENLYHNVLIAIVLGGIWLLVYLVLEKKNIVGLWKSLNSQ